LAEIASVKLGVIESENYDKPRGALPALHFDFDEPASHGAVLRQLGAPTSWASEASPVDVLAPVVRAAAENARRIAMAEPAAAPPPGDDEPTTSKKQKPRSAGTKAKRRSR